MADKRVPLIAGNWKMYKGGQAGVELAKGVAAHALKIEGVDVVLGVPSIVVKAVADAVEGSKVEVAAQNLYAKDEGAFTGEISAPMIVEAGAKWVIIGHSERRQYFGETDASVCEKTVAAMAAGLRPIVCVGELLEEREANKTLEVVHRQLDAVMDALAKRPGYAVVAYEPVWAIGTGKVAGPDQAQEVHAAIRARLAGKSQELADVTRVLYGGSVKPDNAAGLMACADIDGALVGGASLKVEDFSKIIDASK